MCSFSVIRVVHIGCCCTLPIPKTLAIFGHVLAPILLVEQVASNILVLDELQHQYSVGASPVAQLGIEKKNNSAPFGIIFFKRFAAPMHCIVARCLAELMYI
jgi:hypothetical protein